MKREVCHQSECGLARVAVLVTACARQRGGGVLGGWWSVDSCSTMVDWRNPLGRMSPPFIRRATTCWRRGGAVGKGGWSRIARTRLGLRTTDEVEGAWLDLDDEQGYILGTAVIRTGRGGRRGHRSPLLSCSPSIGRQMGCAPLASGRRDGWATAEALMTGRSLRWAVLCILGIEVEASCE